MLSSDQLPQIVGFGGECEPLKKYAGSKQANQNISQFPRKFRESHKTIFIQVTYVKGNRSV